MTDKYTDPKTQKKDAMLSKFYGDLGGRALSGAAWGTVSLGMGAQKLGLMKRKAKSIAKNKAARKKAAIYT
tara:strand:- start:2072 stop:2284 length:213 start_codon:yes stop_codon:yes gene_type:complete